MKPVIIIVIVIPIVVAIIFAGFLIQSTPQQDLERISEKQSDEDAWQLLQKTYLEQECRGKYIGQSEELKKCFERIDEEQRLNPPVTPQESDFEPCSIQCFAYDPVCGKDGVTYACGVEDAACHGVAVEHKGECTVSTSPP
jgi:hypothetical protein